MPQGYDDWKARDDKAKTARIERSLSQAQAREIKRDIVGALYPKKMIGKVDIGEICSFWAYKVMTNLSSENTELIDRLNTLIHLAYEHDIDLNEWMPWKIMMRRKGLKEISETIGGMKTIPKLSFMGNMKKPAKEGTPYGRIRF